MLPDRNPFRRIRANQLRYTRSISQMESTSHMIPITKYFMPQTRAQKVKINKASQPITLGADGGSMYGLFFISFSCDETWDRTEIFDAILHRVR